MVRVAVIGAGNWGKNLVRNLASLAGAELRYICDISDGVRKSMAALYPAARVTGEVGEVMADLSVDAVVVAMDAPLHHRIGRVRPLC